MTIEQQQALALARARRRRAESEVEPDTPSKIAASAPLQFAMGAAEPAFGAIQRLGAGNRNIGQAFPVLSTLAGLAKPSVDEILARFNVMSKEGGASGVPRFAGNVLSPASLGAGKLALPASLAGRSAAGAGLGAVGGYVSPAETEEQAQKNTLLGLMLGGSLPPLIQGAGKAYEYASNKLARPLLDLFTKEGPTNIARNYIRSDKVVGEQNLPNVLARTGAAQELIPRSKPTVGEVVADLPEGSPLIALQNIVSRTGGGGSAKFAERAVGQSDAVVAAEKTRGAITGPMRVTALRAANRGGIEGDPLVAQIDTMMSKPGDRASDVVSKTLGSIRSKIESFTDEATGIINAEDLYTIRKEVGNTIQQHAKETANWDKNLASKLERDIQLQIDDAIKKAGGTGWGKYLNEFSTRSKAIEADLARRELAKNPLQKTNLGGGINIAEETRPHMPNLLSRPAMMANYLMTKAGRGVEPKVDAVMTELFLHPEKFTAIMSRQSPTTQLQIEKALQRANALAFGTANSQ